MLHQKFGGMFLKCVLCKFLFLSLALSSRLAYHNLICTISLTRKKWIIFITQACLWIIPNCLQFFFTIWLLNAHWRIQNEPFFLIRLYNVYIYIGSSIVILLQQGILWLKNALAKKNKWLLDLAPLILLLTRTASTFFNLIYK